MGARQLATEIGAAPGGAGAAEGGDPLPLVLDLDGALLRTDLLWEAALRFVRAAPWRVLLLLAWLAKGRAVLKARLAAAVELDIALLPVNDELAAFAVEERAKGRPVHIATAADAAAASAVLRRFPFVDRLVASDGTVNLKGARKAERLKELFPQGFLYAGDSRADLDVWQAARGTVLVGCSPAVARAAERIRPPLARFERPQAQFRAALKLLRPHQWSKNALVFVPLILGGAALHGPALLDTALAFVALCLVASGTYVVNDLIDLDDDRRHWTKQRRGLASGAVSIPTGLVLVALTLGAGLSAAALSGVPALLGILAYLGGTLAYSFGLKRVPIIDVLALAGLFTLRLGIGVAAAGVPLSPWLLTFSMFLFLSLSLAKRHTELARAVAMGPGKAGGRGYVAADRPMVLALGVGALVAGVLVFVLYLTQEAFAAAHLSQPRLLWLFPPALFLVSARIWLLSGRGELDDDPVAFIVRDRTSLSVVGLLGVVFLAAWGGLPAW